MIVLDTGFLHALFSRKDMRTIVWALGPLLAMWALAGLVWRERVRRAYTLPFLLLALIASAAFVALAPGLYSWRTWLVKEAVHAALLLALGVELAMRVFRNLPGAARVARVVVVGVLIGVSVLVAVAPRQHEPVSNLSLAVLPLVIGGVAVLYTSLAVTTAFFLVPEDPLHAAVLSSLPLYLILYSVWLAELPHDPARAVVDHLLPWVLILVLVHIGRAAWRLEEPPPAPAGLVRILWPWH